MSLALSWPRPPLADNPREPAVPRALARRFAWSGPRARELWNPRLQKLRAAALTIELHEVQTGALPAALIWTPYQDLEQLLVQTAALDLVPVPMDGILEGVFDDHTIDETDLRTALTYPVVVGSAATIATTLELMQRKDDGAIASWFKYPACCAAAWQAALALGLTDPVAAALRARCDGDEAEPIAAHAALAALGIGPVRHAVCSLHCAAAAAAARDFIAAGRALGFASEMTWLEDMAKGGVEYSLAAGIAEIRTALFRCTHLSDATAPLRFQSRGEKLPEGAAVGSGFPFQLPRPGAVAKAKRVEAKAARAEPAYGDIATGWAPAGFDSAFAMRSRFCTVIWEHTKLLRSKIVSALHLGCGDGLLLELTSEVNARLVLFGIDADGGLIAAARRRLPKHAANFRHADWTTSLAGLPAPPGGIVDVLFVDPEPLVAMPEPAAAAIRAELASLARSIVVVASDRALARFGTLTVLAEAAGLPVGPVPGDRVSAVVAAGPIGAATHLSPMADEAAMSARSR
jgi:hypothetical protein